MRSRKKIGLLQTIKWLSKGIKINENLFVLVLWREQIRSRGRKDFQSPDLIKELHFGVERISIQVVHNWWEETFVKDKIFQVSIFHSPLSNYQFSLSPQSCILLNTIRYFSLLSNLCIKQTNRRKNADNIYIFTYFVFPLTD